MVQAGPVTRPGDFGGGMPGQLGGMRAPPAGTQAALLAAFSAQMGLNQVGRQPSSRVTHDVFCTARNKCLVHAGLKPWQCCSRASLGRMQLARSLWRTTLANLGSRECSNRAAWPACCQRWPPRVRFLRVQGRLWRSANPCTGYAMLIVGLSDACRPAGERSIWQSDVAPAPASAAAGAAPEVGFPLHPDAPFR